MVDGDYARLKELAAPRTFDFVAYGRDRGTLDPVQDGGAVVAYRVDPGDGGAAFTLPNPDFAFRSLRGNAVLRWEYRPGSTLFAVWQQQRTDALPFDGFGGLEDLGDVFRAPVENVFLVKLSYWLGR